MHAMCRPEFKSNGSRPPAASPPKSAASNSTASSSTDSSDGAPPGPTTSRTGGSREHLWHRVNSELRRGCYKSVLCKNFSSTGSCPYLARCVFAHGQHELRIASHNFAEGLTSMEAIDRHIHRTAMAHTPAGRSSVSPPLPAGMPMAVPYGVCLVPPPMGGPLYMMPSVYGPTGTMPAGPMPAGAMPMAYPHPLQGTPVTQGRTPLSPPQGRPLSPPQGRPLSPPQGGVISPVQSVYGPQPNWRDFATQPSAQSLSPAPSPWPQGTHSEPRQSPPPSPSDTALESIWGYQ